MVAMSVNEDLACELVWNVARSLTLQKLAEQECLSAQFLGPPVIREKIHQFVAKD